MKICPECGARVHLGAQICRSCYTVIPHPAAVLGRRFLTRLIEVLVLLGLGLAVWQYQSSNPDLLRNWISATLDERQDPWKIDRRSGEQGAKAGTAQAVAPIGAAGAKLRTAEGEEKDVEARSADAPLSDLEAPALGEEFSELAIRVPEPGVCPLPDPCLLTVQFYRGGKAQYEFRRDPQEHELLVTSDSLLTGHLRRHGSASLYVPSRSGEIGIQLSDGNLRQPFRKEEPASWTGLIRGIFGKGEASR